MIANCCFVFELFILFIVKQECPPMPRPEDHCLVLRVKVMMKVKIYIVPKNSAA